MMTGVDQQLQQPQSQQSSQRPRPPPSSIEMAAADNNKQRIPNSQSGSFELVFCKVCNQPTVNRIRCGVLACEACKKFFQRNRENAGTLRCVSGTFDCPLSDDRAALTSSGTVWRLVCPRCRLAKCLAVGMRVLGRKTTKSTTDVNKNQQSKQQQDKPSTSNTVNGSNNSISGSDSSSGDGASSISHNQILPYSDSGPLFPTSKNKSCNVVRNKLPLQQCELFEDINNRSAPLQLTPAHQKMLLINSSSSSSPINIINTDNCNNNNNSSGSSRIPFPLNLASKSPSTAPLSQQSQFAQVIASNNNSNIDRASSPSSSSLSIATAALSALPNVTQPASLIRPTPLTFVAPGNVDNIRNEELLNLTVNAGNDLRQRFEMLPLRAGVQLTNDELSTWKKSMQHYTMASRHVMAYANQLPGFEQLPAEDRCLLYGNAISPISTVQSLQAPLPFVMNALNASNFFKFFPEFSYLSQEAVNINQTLRAWNPSTAEYSLLMALLLYQNHPGLSNPSTVQDIASRLKTLHQSVLTQQNPNDPGLVEARVQQLSQIVDIARSTVANRIESFETFKALRPELLQVGRLYNKIYSNATSNNNDNGNKDNNNNSNNNNEANTSSFLPSSYSLNNNKDKSPPPPAPSGSQIIDV